jgi:hypothetical protein
MQMKWISCNNCLNFEQDTIFVSGFKTGTCRSKKQYSPTRVNGCTIMYEKCAHKDYQAKDNIMINIVHCPGCNYWATSVSDGHRCIHPIIRGRRQSSMDRTCQYHKDTRFGKQVWHQFI